MMRFRQTEPTGCGLHCFSNAFKHDFVSLLENNPELGSMNDFQENEVLSSVFPNYRIQTLFHSQEPFRPFLWNGIPKLIKFFTNGLEPTLKGNEHVSMLLTIPGNPLHCVNLLIYTDRMVLDDPISKSYESYSFGDKYSHYLATDWLKRRIKNIWRIGVYSEYGNDTRVRALIFGLHE